MNKDFLSWLGHAGSHTCMIQNAGTTYYFVRVQKNEDFDYLYCQRQYSGKGLARGGTFKYYHEVYQPVRPQYGGYLNHGAQAQRKGH